MRALTKTRRRRTLAGVVSTFLVCAVAFAAWLAIDVIEGEGTTTTGKAATISAPLKVAFEPSEGFTPEKTTTCGPAMNCEGGEFMNATIEAPTGTTAHTITAYTTTITDTASECPASSYVLVATDPGTKAVTIGASNLIEIHGEGTKLPAGKSSTPAWPAGDVKIEVTETAPQTCEAAGVKVKLKAN